jgi:hypothetical protein
MDKQFEVSNEGNVEINQIDELVELKNFELALVGGGTGEVIFA